jgi:hypothetical protein
MPFDGRGRIGAVMNRVGWRERAVKALIERAIVRLETEQPDSPLLKLDRPHLRRILATAAYREIRALRREVQDLTGESPADV